jgi:hypothetical protein
MYDSYVSRQVMRTLFIKMTYLIDTGKQLPLFEELSTQLYDEENANETHLMLMFQVFNDCV